MSLCYPGFVDHVRRLVMTREYDPRKRACLDQIESRNCSHSRIRLSVFSHCTSTLITKIWNRSGKKKNKCLSQLIHFCFKVFNRVRVIEKPHEVGYQRRRVRVNVCQGVADADVHLVGPYWNGSNRSISTLAGSQLLASECRATEYDTTDSRIVSRCWQKCFVDRRMSGKSLVRGQRMVTGNITVWNMCKQSI